MNYEIVVQSEPTIEMQKAFEWYEYKQEGKGFEMIEEIEAAYEKERFIIPHSVLRLFTGFARAVFTA
jgi:hypothetical protein